MKIGSSVVFWIDSGGESKIVCRIGSSIFE